MTIRGEEYLKNDSYNKIIVNGTEIKFLNGTEQITLCDVELAEQLKNMNKEEQITAIIDYFISTNSVGGIIYGCMPNGIENNVIISNDDKALIIEEQISLIDSEKIYNSYNENRLNVLHNKPHDNYIISSKYEGTTLFNSEDNTLKFELAHKSNLMELDLREVEFLKELVETLFAGERIAYDLDKEIKAGNEIFKGWYLVSEDSNMKVKLECLPFYKDILTAIIYNHNCELSENKQLKMEGF